MSYDEKEWFAGRGLEDKHERDYLRRLLLGSLLAIFFCWALIYAAASHAASYSFTSGADRVTLMETPCQLGGWFKDWKSATFMWKGKTYEACWRINEGVVIIIDSGGDITPVPMQAFKRDQAV